MAPEREGVFPRIKSRDSAQTKISAGVHGGAMSDATRTQEERMAKTALRRMLKIVIDEIQGLSDLIGHEFTTEGNNGDLNAFRKEERRAPAVSS